MPPTTGRTRCCSDRGHTLLSTRSSTETGVGYLSHRIVLRYQAVQAEEQPLTSILEERVGVSQEDQAQEHHQALFLFPRG